MRERKYKIYPQPRNSEAALAAALSTALTQTRKEMKLLKTPSWRPACPLYLIFNIGPLTHTRRVSTNAERNKGNDGGSHIFHTGTHTGFFLSTVRLNTQLRAGGCGRHSPTMHCYLVPSPSQARQSPSTFCILFSPLVPRLVFFPALGTNLEILVRQNLRSSVCISKAEHGHGNRFLFTSFGRLIFPFATNNLQLEVNACQTMLIENTCESCRGFRSNQKSFQFPFQRPKQQLACLIHNQIVSKHLEGYTFLCLQTDSFLNSKQENLTRSFSYTSSTHPHCTRRVRSSAGVTHCFHIIRAQRWSRSMTSLQLGPVPPGPPMNLLSRLIQTRDSHHSELFFKSCQKY